MRFMHLADLHLGKQMCDLSLLPDQAYMLGQICDIAEREKVDAVLIAGDVYQRAAPQAEAMALFDSFVSRLSGMGLPVFIISGNHDSAPRISYFSSLLRASGVYVTEAFDGSPQHVSLRDADGEIVIWMIPFLRPAQVKRFLPEERILTSQDAMAAVLRQADLDPRKRNILLAHQFVLGAEPSDSEDRSVGGLDGMDAALFDAFDYVALGHIHKPQRIGRDTLRYAGSPLKYSFSEANHAKSVTLVDLYEKGDIALRTVPLYPLRDVRCLEGTLEELMRLPYSEDYLWITLRDELPPPDARVTLSTNYPNLMKFSIRNSRTKTDMDVLAAERMENRTVLELISDFYRLQNNDRLPGEAHQKMLKSVLRALEEAET